MKYRIYQVQRVISVFDMDKVHLIRLPEPFLVKNRVDDEFNTKEEAIEGIKKIKSLHPSFLKEYYTVIEIY